MSSMIFQQLFVIYGEHIWLICLHCNRRTLFRTKDHKNKIPYSINIICEICRASGWTIRVISEIPEEDIPEE